MNTSPSAPALTVSLIRRPRLEADAAIAAMRFGSSPFYRECAIGSPSFDANSIGTINAIGWPRLVDTYRVDFQVPAGTPAGIAAIQLSAAWIQGSAVSISIQ